MKFYSKNLYFKVDLTQSFDFLLIQGMSNDFPFLQVIK